MDKINRLFLYSSDEHMCSNRAFDKIFPDPGLHVQDKRVARLLELLQQLNEDTEGLRSLPKHELR